MDGFNELVLAGRADLAPGGGAAGVREVPAPDRHRLHPGVHGVHLRRLPGHRGRCWWSCSRPGSTPRRRQSTEDRDCWRRTGSPSPSPASSTPWPASTRTGSCASYLTLIQATLRTNVLPARRRRPAQVLRGLQARPAGDPRPAGAPAAVRDLRLLAPGRGRAPALRRGGPRRAALVRPAGGLPHRGARPGQGADGEERRDRPGRRQGRLRAQAGAAGHRPGGVPGRGRRLLPRVHLRRCSTSPTTSSAAQVVPPPDVVRHDGDDPYLVVAADKGTATFSDIANEIAAAYGFWLGDAFASGGSAGYDHKAMGITARGAWESVQRHFRETGRRRPDAGLHRRRHRRHVRRRVRQRDAAVRAHPAGGRLRPPAHLRRPRPRTPARRFAERRRLFDLPRSSWDDYDPSLISRRRRGLPADGQVDPGLAAGARGARPRRRAGHHADPGRADPGDPAGPGRPALERRDRHLRQGRRPRPTPTSATRPTTRSGSTARDLRAKVVGEGGNLGLTQRGRIEYALPGGRINTDSIDNSAGVDCSDHEVNIKILLDRPVGDGDLDREQRNELLAEMTDEVGRAGAAGQLRAGTCAGQLPGTGSDRCCRCTAA